MTRLDNTDGRRSASWRVAAIVVIVGAGLLLHTAPLHGGGSSATTTSAPSETDRIITEVSRLHTRMADLRRQGQFAEAVAPAAEARALAERAFGSDHWRTIDARCEEAAVRQGAALSSESQQELAAADRATIDVERLFSEGKLQEALDVARRQLATRERLIGRRSLDGARSLHNLGVILQAAGEFAEAEPILREALEARRATLGDDHRDVMEAYGQLATLAHARGEYEKAEGLYRETLARQERVLSSDDALLLVTKNNLAVLLCERGDYAGAEGLHRELLDVRVKKLGENNPDVGLTLTNLADVYDHRGEFAAAEPLLRRALVIFDKTLGHDHPRVMHTLNNLASVLHGMGDYAAAETLYRESIAMRRKLNGPRHLGVATALNNLAKLLSDRGQYAEAEELYLEALDIRQEVFGEEHPDIAVLLNNLAAVRRNLGRPEEAEALYRRSLELRRKLFGPKHWGVALALHNIASVQQDRGELDSAEALYNEALALLHQTSGPTHPLVADTLENMSALHVARGRPMAAADVLREALQIDLSVLGEAHPDTIATRSTLGAALFLGGDRPGAEEQWSAAVRAFETARRRAARAGLERSYLGKLVAPHVQLAALRAAAGDGDGAWEAIQAELGRGLLDLLAAAEARRLTDADAGRERRLLEELDRLDQQLTALLAATDEASIAERRRLASRRDEAQAELGVLEREFVQRYGSSEGQVAPRARVAAALREDEAIVGWVDAVISSDMVGHPGEHWVFVLRHNGAPQWRRLSGSGAGGAWAPEDERLPAAFRAALEDRASLEQVSRMGRALETQRLGPARDLLEGVRRLIVIPSGLMLGLPVEAIAPSSEVAYAPSATVWLRLTQEGNELAGTRALLAFGDPEFARTGPGQGVRGPMAASSRPALSISRAAVTAETRAWESRLEPLPWTRREVQTIARIFSESTPPTPTRGPPETSCVIKVGPEASEQAILELAGSDGLRRFRFIHIATHAFPDDQSPARSCLVLSGTPEGDPLAAIAAGRPLYDGYVTMQQVLRGWRLDAELVALSACRTGLGRNAGGEGYVGFAQAFLQAGAQSVLVSLWQVDDLSTSLLMQDFYRNLLERRMTKAAALRSAQQRLRSMSWEEVERIGGVSREQAQRAMGSRGAPGAAVAPKGSLRETRPFEHPYFWAAFVLIGDPE